MNEINLQTKELIDSIKNLTIQLEKNNTCTNPDKSEPHNLYYYIKRYIQEILEASFGLIMVMFILKKNFNILDFISIVCIIGLITLILEEYNIEYLHNFKEGILFTIGSLAFSS